MSWATAARPGGAPRGARADRGTAAGILVGLSALFLLTVLLGTVAGTVPLAPGRVLAALFGLPVSQETHIIVWAIRLPRVVLGALVGAALALAGAVLQGLLRNPLADPGLLGVSAGAGFAAVVAIAAGAATASLWVLPFWAFCGALVASALVYAMALRQGRTSVLTLILAGVAVSALFGAGTTLVLTLHMGTADVSSMFGWLFGSLDGALWRQDAVLAPLVAFGALGMLRYARDLNLLATGEDGAAALGVAVERSRQILLVLAALMTGAAVAMSGVVSFVGLMVPHILRLLVGADHRRLLPASVLGGATFVVLADLVARVVVRPAELNLGVVTAILGVPFFLYLLGRTAGGGA